MTQREALVETVNKLFIYTDEQQWKLLIDEVFSNRVMLDMTTVGGPSGELTAQEICDMWKQGFKDLDAINHLSGNFLVDIVDDDMAKVFCYATATHYKESAVRGCTREFVGTYDIKLNLENNSWKISGLKYNLKYMNGNIELN